MGVKAPGGERCASATKTRKERSVGSTDVVTVGAKNGELSVSVHPPACSRRAHVFVGAYVVIA